MDVNLYGSSSAAAHQETKWKLPIWDVDGPKGIV